MILTCPACDTRYFVSDEAIGPNGRRVRCKSCGHDWRASLEDEPLELTPGTQSVMDSPLTGAASGAEAQTDPVSDNLSETPAPELPRAFRAKAEQKRRMRQAAKQGAAWVGLLAVVLGLIMAALAFREPVVRAWPQMASFYRAVGFPVNLAGVEVEALRGVALVQDPDKILVGGALRNIRDTEVVPPSPVIVLRDQGGNVVLRHQVDLDGPPILPGQVQGFAAVVRNPQSKGVGISIDFAFEGEAAPIAENSSEKSAPKRRPLPVADNGLRPASAFEDVPIQPAPLDKKGH